MPSENRKKPRRTEYIQEVEKFYIFCEGEKTEPIYFEGFKKAIQQNPIYKSVVTIEVKGTGRETLRVLEYALNYIRSNRIENSNIWCVYDKDDFDPQDFNAVTQRINALNSNRESSNKFFSAWSNQCIEYWFLLHFDFYTSDNHRKDYRKYLHAKFSELGWNKYEKNNDELFNIMSLKGNPKQAIIYAERQLQNFDGQTPSNSAPATTVHTLIKKIAMYLPEEVKKLYV